VHIKFEDLRILQLLSCDQQDFIIFRIIPMMDD
jgi:hypothetical protein